ncbi:dj-1 family domain-containing protein [Cyclospora cayetanensis]|uniref:FAD synthase n=1 Tax=Cyclospora cayetanensis TaxID=88456 RepID=A0A1D3D526_9EIME|nr:dj-1 family domain-containing protein [Cyclospora cayetanensis]
MQTLNPPLAEMRGEAQAPATRLPQSGLAGCSGASHCSNCWPRVAFDSAASLLRGIEELNGSDGVDVCKSASQSKDSRQQQPKEEDKASVCPRACAGLALEALELLVDILRVYYSDWASGLRSFLSQRPHTPFAFVLGTRNTDPQGLTESLQFLQPSSRWLPPFLRVQPLLKFGYGHVWDFLRYFKLPYCCLYDQGYSSIGTMENTRPNPLLIPSDGGAALPAYELLSWEREREGRFKKQRKESKTVAVS